MTVVRNDAAVFFVRHYNDVDHMAPVAWRCAFDGPVRIVVTDEAAEQHPLIGVFQAETDIEITHLRTYAGTLTDVEARAALARNKLDPGLLIDGVGRRPAICLDWDYQDAALRIAEAAGERGLVSISLPHGDAPYINLLINLDDLDGDLARSYERAWSYDHTAVPNDVCASRYRTLPAGRLHVIGSLRYCRTWIDRLPRLVSEAEPPLVLAGHGAGLRIGVFLRNANFPIHWEEFAKSLELMQASGACTIVLKHHTRDKRMSEVLERFPVLADGADGIEISTPQESSASVLDRVDLVVDLGTSIAFEAVLRAMPVIELEYVHPNRSTVAEYLPRTEVRTRDELVAALAAGHADLSSLRPTPEEIDRFRSAIVEPAGRQVLDRYLDLIRTAEPA